MSPRVERILRSGVRCIAGGQDASGCIPSLTSPDPHDFAGAPAYRTTFCASQALICLGEVAALPGLPAPLGTKLRGIRAGLAGFLKREASGSGSWNYWASDEPERLTRPYPDDNDDTFAALTALTSFDPALVDGAILARAARILTATEIAPGGPYRTWLVGRDGDSHFQDVDVVVNGTIAHFLRTQDVDLPRIAAFQEEAVRSGSLASRYYPDSVHAAYLLARAYRGPLAADVAAQVLGQRRADRTWGSALETAMAVTALARLGCAREIAPEDRDAFLRMLEEGPWQPHAFCIDPARDGRTQYAGAAALTAALCLEALAVLEGAARAEESSAFPPGRRARIHDAVLAGASAACDRFGPELRAVAKGLVEANDDHEITLLPYRFAEALGARAAGIAPALLERLARANLWGWLAYTVYDDFLDGEGDPRSLSAANAFLRALTGEYADLAREIPAIREEFADALDAIDHANAWEQERCRPRVDNGILAIPDRLPFATYGMLADRSIGHALPAIALLHAAGTRPDELRAAKAFFRHYLIARQLHDDAHDWAEDLSRGQVNSVGARVLAAWQEARPGAVTTDLAADMAALRELFWKSVAGTSVRAILRHAAQARRALALTDLPGAAELGEDILAPLERGAARTLREREKALAFLAAYGGS